MSSLKYFVKLTMALVCLGLSIFAVIQGESLIKPREGLQNKEEPPPQNQNEAKSAELFSEFQQKAADLSKATDEFEKDRARITKATQDAQAEINKGNQSYQYLSTMVNQIYALTDETKPNGKKDDQLKALVAKDVEGSNIIRVQEPPPSPLPPVPLNNSRKAPQPGAQP